MKDLPYPEEELLAKFKTFEVKPSNLPKKAPIESRSSNEKPSQTDCKSDGTPIDAQVIEYDNHGHALISNRNIISSKGFEVGSTVVEKQPSCKKGDTISSHIIKHEMSRNNQE